MIFVTGGTGLLGNTIVREFCDRGISVRALCRPGTEPLALAGLPVEIVKGDLESKQVLQQAIEGCEAVIHSAAMIHIGWHKLTESRAVNVAGTQTLVSACQQAGVRLVHVSTVDTLPAAVDLDHPIRENGRDSAGGGGVAKTPCTYVVSKSESEAVVRKAIASEGLDAVIVHPGFMLGPHDWKPSSGRMMLEVNKAPIVAAPPGGCSLCDARDVAAAIANAVKSGRSGANYILAGENLSYQNMWQQMLTTAGKSRRVFRLGKAVKLVGSIIDAAVRWLPISEGDVNGAAIAMGALNHYYDSTLAEQELGYRRRPTEETLRDAWQWLSREQ